MSPSMPHPKGLANGRTFNDELGEVFMQFGRAYRKLGIKIITAHSPEAKGWVERNHGIYQVRLVLLDFS